MTQVLVEREFENTMTPGDVIDMSIEGSGCFQAWNVIWHGSLLASSGTKLLCLFEAVDIESIRQALRQAGETGEVKAWPVNVHENADFDSDKAFPTTVVVERVFEKATSLASIQAMEDAAIKCLNQRNVSFLRTYFSLDTKTMFCVYQAPDAESVRIAQQLAKMPVDSVWSCDIIIPKK